MIGKLSKIVLLIISLLLFGAYKSYWIQRENYEGHIVMRLQGVCSDLMQRDYGVHASTFDISEKHNYRYGIKSEFTISNDLLSLEVYGRSTVHFSDYAPQEVACRASLLYGSAGYGKNAKITKNTMIDVFILGVRYLPKKYENTIVHKPSLRISMREAEDMSPLIKLFPLEKPKYNIFSFYLSKL